MPTYFSQARGLRKNCGLPELRLMVGDLFKSLKEKEHLKEWLGYYCVDEGEVPGVAGHHPEREIRLEVGRVDIWPPDPVAGAWSEDAIFDFLQYIGSKVSSAIPDTGRYHAYDNCGQHGEDFTPEPARGQYIERLNKILEQYGDGWEMKPGFEIVERAPAGLTELLTVKLPQNIDSKMRQRVHDAVSKFRRRTSSGSERRDAVRDLGDVFEPLRDQARAHLGKDESDLFNILNNFNIRHSNEKQKEDYDPIWLSGLFYHYLTMIHVLTYMIEREKAGGEKT